DAFEAVARTEFDARGYMIADAPTSAFRKVTISLRVTSDASEDKLKEVERQAFAGWPGITTLRAPGAGGAPPAGTRGQAAHAAHAARSAAALARQSPSLGAGELAQLLLAHRCHHLAEAPLRLAFERSPRLAASAAPAAICCFFDLAGMKSSWQPTSGARPQAASYAKEHLRGGRRFGTRRARPRPPPFVPARRAA